MPWGCSWHFSVPLSAPQCPSAPHVPSQNFIETNTKGEGIIRRRDIKNALYGFSVPLTPREFEKLWTRYVEGHSPDTGRHGETGRHGSEIARHKQIQADTDRHRQADTAQTGVTGVLCLQHCLKLNRGLPLSSSHPQL